MEYSPKLALLFVLASAMAAAVVTAQNSAQDFVDLHNAARAEVGVGPVTWDGSVAAWAQDYAETHRSDCELKHSPRGRPYGENLYGGAGGGASWSAADAVNAWVSEKAGYDYGSNTCSLETCLHYTQVVWRSSTAIGCARVVCDSGDGLFIICSYDPPGNFIGQSPY
jgi:pathogenesis-related protein 1